MSHTDECDSSNFAKLCLLRQGTWSRADYLKVRHEKKGREKILELSHNKKNILAANKSFQTEKAQERKK